jgi:hypothetical protein
MNPPIRPRVQPNTTEAPEAADVADRPSDDFGETNRPPKGAYEL